MAAFSGKIIARDLTPDDDGLYPQIPPHIYHSCWKALSKSEMGELARSPAHLRAYRTIKRVLSTTQRRTFDIGTATHLAILEPDAFDDTVRLRPDGHPNSTAHKEAVEDIYNRNPNALILSQVDYDSVWAMRDSVQANRAAQELIAGCQPEVSAIWTDPETGVRCRGRADVWQPHTKIIADVKTTVDARSEAFRKQIYRYGYYIQVGYYLRGWDTLGYGEDVRFALIAIEKKPPYAIAIYELDLEWLLMAQDEISALLKLYARCVREKRWPSYGQTSNTLAPTAWQIADSESQCQRLARLEHATAAPELP